MRLPRFTAEASLEPTHEAYHLAPRPASAERVVPQSLCYQHEGGAVTCCDCYYGYCWCRTILPRVLM
jgi:hypothetical protein